MEERLNHRRKIGGYLGPTLILHTGFDQLVGVGHALRLKDWAGGDTTLCLFDHGDHNSIFWENSDDYLTAVGGFLNTVRARH